MHIDSSYLHRMTALYAIQVLTESLDVDMLGKVCVCMCIKSWGEGRIGRDKTCVDCCPPPLRKAVGPSF